MLRRPGTFDAAVCLMFLAAAFALTRGLWPDPTNRVLAHNVNDQTLIEWFLAHGTLVWTGDFSLVTYRLNAPAGVNLMSNASHIVHGVLMAPVTAVFGVAVSFALIVLLNLAATAAAWYLLLVRTFHVHRAAAMVGAALIGFGPGMISQSNSHLHITAQWLIPPIIWCVVNLTRPLGQRPLVLTSIGLALLVAVQVLLGEEVLFLAALTLALFAVAYTARRPRWALRVAPRFIAGMGIATGLATVLLAYPLWVQLAGPMHTPNAPFGSAFYYSDVASFPAFSPLSIAGDAEAGRLASSATEYNTYLGWPLLVALAVCLVYLWRAASTLAIVFSGAVMTWLSLGPTVTVGRKQTTFPALYDLIDGAPVISGALPTRYSLVLLPLIAVVLTFAISRALRETGRRTWLRVSVPLAVGAALVPLFPLQLATTDRAPVPAFITSGQWRQCVPEGGVMVPVPLATALAPEPMRWAAAANDGFSMPEGFFIGPYGTGGTSSIGGFPRPTSQLLAKVAREGHIPIVGDTERLAAEADLRYWRADCVVLADVTHARALELTLTDLLGPGRAVADVTIWDVRGRR
jgi:hypothetical protein